MGKKDIILLSIVIILAVCLAVLFLFLIPKQEEIGLVNITVNTNKQSNINESANVNVGANENENTNTQIEEITFEKFFKVVYLAKFAGGSNPPVVSEFNINDKIVMSVRVVAGLKTELKMQPKIYKDDKLISDDGPVEILDGEVGLKNPSNKGDYELRLFVDDTLVKTVTFKIN